MLTGAERGAHSAGKLGGDEDAETGGAGAAGDGGGAAAACIDGAPDWGGKTRTVIADADQNAVAFRADEKLAGMGGIRIMKSVLAEVSDDGAEKSRFAPDEPDAGVEMRAKVAATGVKLWFELVGDFLAESAGVEG